MPNRTRMTAAASLAPHRRAPTARVAGAAA